MNVFDTRYELVGQQEHCLQREFAVAEVEEILQAGPKQIENHGIIVTFGAEPTNKGNANTSSERLVNTGFIFQLGMLGLDRLQLNGDLFARDDIGSEIDVTEGTRADLPTDTVLITDTKIHCSHIDDSRY